jgi:lysophospholipase L1-like esterase
MKKILGAAMGAWLTLTCAAVAQMTPGGGAPMVPIGGPSIGQVVRSVSGNTFNDFGDSIAEWNDFGTPAGSTFPSGTSFNVGTSAASTPGWLTNWSNNALVIDYSSGYPGAQAYTKAIVATAGSGCTPSTSLTFTPSAPTGSPANQASAFNITTSASGVIPVGTTVVIATPGSGYTSLPTLTISGGSCSTAPVFTGVITGTFTFGVGGDTTAGLIQRIPDVCANPPDWLRVSAGRNDLVAGISEATIVTNLTSIVNALRACNIRIILRPISPQTIGVGGWTQAMDAQRLRINRWISQYAQQTKLAGGVVPQVLTYDIDHFWSNAGASGGSAGNPFASYVFDGLHPAISGAQYEAMALLNVLKPYLAQNIYMPNSQNDLYDGTNNPTGNLLGGTVGLMLGTGGTTNANAGGTCPAGAIATSWQFSYSGSGTITCTATQETSRTDGLAGQRQVITYSNAAGGTAEKLTFANFVNYGANLTKGVDSIYATVEIDVSNLANVQYIGLQLLETATTSQIAACVNSGSAGTGFYMIPSATMALLQEAKMLPDFGLTASGSYRISCRTGVIPTQVGSTGFALSIIMQGTSNAGNMTATLKISNAAVRKAAN